MLAALDSPPPPAAAPAATAARAALAVRAVLAGLVVPAEARRLPGLMERAVTEVSAVRPVTAATVRQVQGVRLAPHSASREPPAATAEPAGTVASVGLAALLGTVAEKPQPGPRALAVAAATVARAVPAVPAVPATQVLQAPVRQAVTRAAVETAVPAASATLVALA